MVPGAALMIFKFYDPVTKELRVIGHRCVSPRGRIQDYQAVVCKSAKLPPGTPLKCCEELSDNRYPPVDQTMNFHAAELQHGDILVWAPEHQLTKSRRDLQQSLQALHNLLVVEFRDVSDPSTPGKLIDLDGRDLYKDFVSVLARALRVPWTHVQLTTRTTFRTVGSPGPSEFKVRSSTNLTLQKLLYQSQTFGKEREPIMYYEKIDLPLSELENMVEVQLDWLDLTGEMTVEKHLYHMPKDCTVGTSGVLL